MSEAPDILLEITAQRRRRLGVAATPPPPVDAWTPLDRRRHPLLSALALPGASIIAEVKLGSPRLGDLRRRVDAEALASAYAAAGASALSVVVEPDYFFGSYEILEACRRASGLPTLAKDFVVGVAQLDAAAAAGADAILLIAALYEPAELATYADAARARGLAPLVEIHTAADLRHLEGRAWELVGVNNRDLRTFEVDVRRSRDLLPRLPPDCVSVAESGLSRRAEVELLADAGFDAFLIGEALLLADDPGAELQRLAAADSKGAV